jgi:ABC-type nitrate/sulfonate/bicarbonate transport system permease component
MSTPAVTQPVSTDGATTPVAPGRGSRARAVYTDTRVLKIASIVLILVVWEIYGRSTNPLLFTAPSRVARATVEMISDGELLPALGQSLLVLAIGLALGTLAGIALGLLDGRSRIAAALMDLPTIALYATPMVALVPVLVLWFGFGMVAKIVIVFLFAIFPVLINTSRGVRETDPRLEEVARAFCSSERRMWRDLTLPSALPYIVTGIRLAIGRGLIGVVVAEFYTSISGLGYVIVSNANVFRTDRMFVPILVLMFLGVVLTKSLEVLERRLSPWTQKG